MLCVYNVKIIISVSLLMQRKILPWLLCAMAFVYWEEEPWEQPLTTCLGKLKSYLMTTAG